MSHLRAITVVIFGIGVLASGSLPVGHAVAQPEPARVDPPAVRDTRVVVERDFDTDWHREPARPSILSGCVYNRYGALAQGVTVGVEGLGANGAVVSSTTTWVGNVPARSYGHFELPVLASAAKYRIKVLAYEWLQGG